MTDFYKPPRSYWKEVTSLDDTIRDRSQKFPLSFTFGIFPTFVREAIWANEDQIIRWENSNLISARMTSLIVADVVTVDPASEGLAVDPEITTGVALKFYSYTLGLTPRMLRVAQDYTPDIYATFTDAVQSQESKRLNRQAGILLPQEEDYEALLMTLREGANMDEFINIQTQDQ